MAKYYKKDFLGQPIFFGLTLKCIFVTESLNTIGTVANCILL